MGVALHFEAHLQPGMGCRIGEILKNTENPVVKKRSDDNFYIERKNEKKKRKLETALDFLLLDSLFVSHLWIKGIGLFYIVYNNSRIFFYTPNYNTDIIIMCKYKQ